MADIDRMIDDDRAVPRIMETEKRGKHRVTLRRTMTGYIVLFDGYQVCDTDDSMVAVQSYTVVRKVMMVLAPIT